MAHGGRYSVLSPRGVCARVERHRECVHPVQPLSPPATHKTPPHVAVHVAAAAGIQAPLSAALGVHLQGTPAGRTCVPRRATRPAIAWCLPHLPAEAPTNALPISSGARGARIAVCKTGAWRGWRRQRQRVQSLRCVLPDLPLPSPCPTPRPTLTAPRARLKHWPFGRTLQPFRQTPPPQIVRRPHQVATAAPPAHRWYVQSASGRLPATPHPTPAWPPLLALSLSLSLSLKSPVGSHRTGGPGPVAPWEETQTSKLFFSRDSHKRLCPHKNGWRRPGRRALPTGRAATGARGRLARRGRAPARRRRRCKNCCWSGRSGRQPRRRQVT